MKHIEYEERLLITENDYKKVIADIKKSRRNYIYSYIENVYLDNKEGYIKNNHLMLRLRTIDKEEQELTLKIRNPEGGHLEITEPIICHPEVDKCLGKPLEEFKEIARLRTERMELPTKDYTFVLDKNYYGDVIDYNIEVEAKSMKRANEVIRFFCNRYGIEYKKDSESKSKRAIEYFQK